MLMRNYVVAGALMVAVAANGFAADAKAPDYKGPALDYKTIPSGVYVLDQTHASIIWKIEHLGFSTFAGRFEDITGTATVNPNDLSKSSVVIAVETDGVDSGVDALDEHLEKAEYLDAEKFPNITFSSTKVEVTGKDAAGKDTGKIYGMLSLKGVSKPVVLDVVFNGHGVGPFGGPTRMGFNGTTTIKRSDFGINAGIPMVGDSVQLEIAAEFTKK